MNKSEQAQAIAEIKSIREALADKRNAHAFDEHSMRQVLRLVDSQAQKIAELENRNRANLSLLKEAQTRFETAYADNVKQENEIERLKKERDEARNRARDWRESTYHTDVEGGGCPYSYETYCLKFPLPWEKQ